MEEWRKLRLLHAPIRLPNRIFEAEYRYIRWPRTENDVRRFERVSAVTACIMTLLLVLVDHAVYHEQSLKVLLLMLLVINIGVTLATDLYALLIAVNRVGRQIETGQWEELKLTFLTRQEIFDGKYAITQIRARRATVGLIVLRLIPLFGVTAVIVIDVLFGYGVLLRRLAFLALTQGHALILLGILAVPFLMYLCFYEPMWQMQTVSALGILFPLLTRNQLMAALSGFASILVLRAVQFAMLAAIAAALYWFTILQDYFVFCLTAPLFLFVVPTLVYLYHTLIRNFTLDWGSRRVF